MTVDITASRFSPTTRRQFLTRSGMAAAGLASAGLWSADVQARPRRKPNFIFILTDDLGYGELGAYAQDEIQTPNLDRMAAEGVRFTDCYSGGPVCAPSRCALLTGLHTGHCRVRKNEPQEPPAGTLQPEDTTFGELLQSTGYRTALFGKWGFGPEEGAHYSHPNQKGFDEFFGYITHRSAHFYFPTHLWENEEQVSLPENENDKRQTFAPDLFVQRSLDFLERNSDDPFMLFLNLNLCHAQNDIDTFGPYANSSWPKGEKAHAAQIDLIDTYTGEILDKLKQLGVDENTIVFFTSDNGAHEEGGTESYGESPEYAHDPGFFDSSGPLRGLKRNLYEGGVRVPMIVRSPRIMNATVGKTSAQAWSFWDVLPTLADFAGVRSPRGLDGVSMRRTLTGRAQRDPEYQYWYRLDTASLPYANAADNGRLLRACEAVREGRWKAIRFAPGKDRNAPDRQWDEELYDLSSGPGRDDKRGYPIPASHSSASRSHERCLGRTRSNYSREELSEDCFERGWSQQDLTGVLQIRENWLTRVSRQQIGDDAVSARGSRTRESHPLSQAFKDAKGVGIQDAG